MESYYARQASLPHFSGHYRQRGSGFGALAAGIGRFALPVAKKFILPAAKKLGKELILQGAPELLEVVTRKKSAKKAAGNTIKRAIRKQVGGSAKQARRSRTRKLRRKKPTTSRKKLKTSVKKKNTSRRSRVDFFSKVKNDR